MEPPAFIPKSSSENNVLVDKTTVKSSSSDATYDIISKWKFCCNDKGEQKWLLQIGCSCPSWIRGSAAKGNRTEFRMCKHTIQKNSLHKEQMRCCLNREFFGGEHYVPKTVPKTNKRKRKAASQSGPSTTKKSTKKSSTSSDDVVISKVLTLEQRQRESYEKAKLSGSVVDLSATKAAAEEMMSDDYDRQADALISGIDLDNLDDFSDSYEQYVKIESSSDFAKSFLQTVS